MSGISGESVVEKFTLELSLEAWVKPGIEGQRVASHKRYLSLSLDVPITPAPGPLVLLVVVGVTSTLSFLMVCGVLILAMKHPTGMAIQGCPPLH